METRVVTVNIWASVAGIDLAVTGATITLGVNAIPRIELQCAPSRDIKQTQLKPTVKKPKIADFSDLYKELSVKAEGLTEPGYVIIDVTENIGDDVSRSDTLELNDWILSGVGLSSVNANAAPYLSVILQHPICLLTKVGSVYETPKTKIDKALNAATAGASNFLDIVVAAYKCVRDNKYWPSPNDFPPQFRLQLGEGVFDPKEHLEWKGGPDGIFLGKAVSEQSRLAQAMGRLAIPGSSGSSTWDMLIASCGSLLLSITQDEACNYTQQKLVLEPTRPWKAATLTLNDDDCFWTELPGMDAFKIAGVMARRNGPYSEPVSIGFLPNGSVDETDPVEHVLYVPVPSEKVTTADGRIMMTNAPAVLDAAFRRDAPYGGTIATAQIKTLEARRQEYNKALLKYCQAVYETTAASMIQARAQMALWFHDFDGQLILPGNTCKFTSDGKDIYYGYARQVIHHMSSRGGCATTVDMSYVRPDADFKINNQTAIAAGAPNAAYT